jgi:methionyl-tRNA formyltransferase
MVLGTLTALGSITAVKQSSDGVTYAKKITKDDEIINWAEGAEKIRNKIRGLNPFPGAYFMHEGKKIKLFDVDIENAKGNPGEVLDERLLIACGSGAIRIKKLQKEGKKPMTAQEFLNGSIIAKGANLNSAQ